MQLDMDDTKVYKNVQRALQDAERDSRARADFMVTRSTRANLLTSVSVIALASAGAV